MPESIGGAPAHQGFFVPEPVAKQQMINTVTHIGKTAQAMFPSTPKKPLTVEEKSTILSLLGATIVGMAGLSAIQGNPLSAIGYLGAGIALAIMGNRT